MKTIINLAWKDLRLIQRDWLGVFFIIFFPIAMGIFFGAVMTQSSNESPKFVLSVVDEDLSDRSKRFVELLAAEEGITVEASTRDSAIDDVRRGKRVGVIVVPDGFGETAGIMWSTEPTKLQLGTDPGRAAEAGMIEGVVMQAIGQLTMERFQDSESMRPIIEDSLEQIETAEGLSVLQRTMLKASMSSLDKFLEDFDQAQEELANSETGDSAGVSFNFAEIEKLELTKTQEPSEQQKLVSKINSGWDISFPSAMLWGVLACVAGFAVSIVRERTRGTWVRLKIAPIRRSQILIGKAAACYVTTLAVIGMMTAIGMLLGMRPGNYLHLAIAALVIAYCYVGIMMTLSVIGKTEEVVAGASWGANVVFAMFGGAMVPLAFLPSFMQPLSSLSPVKWAILSLEGAIWRQFTFGEMLLPLSVLAAIGTVGMIVGCLVLSRD